VVISTSWSRPVRGKRPSDTLSVCRPQSHQLTGRFDVVVKVCLCQTPIIIIIIIISECLSTTVCPAAWSFRRHRQRLFVSNAHLTLSKCLSTTVSPAEWSFRRHGQHLFVSNVHPTLSKCLSTTVSTAEWSFRRHRQRLFMSNAHLTLSECLSATAQRLKLSCSDMSLMNTSLCRFQA